MRLNYKTIGHFFGLLLLCNGVFILTAGLVGFGFGDATTPMLLSSASIVLGLGIIAMLVTKNHSREMGRRDGYIVVALGWIVMAISGALPYVMTGVIPEFTNAFFETVSGYTTTGATILTDIESVPKGVLFWRSLTHWIGGMGIIVLAIAILPLLGIGGMQLFTAEAPGLSSDKLHPRITDTAKRLWFIYVGLTLAETLLLNWAGMPFFDAINHAMATVSTGGFSTKNSSLMFYNHLPMVQYIVMFFMLVAGSNFVLTYFAIKGKWKKIWGDEEFMLYIKFIAIFTLVTASIIYLKSDFLVPNDEFPMVYGIYEADFRHSMFQVLSVITTTGFVTADFTSWTPFLTVLFFGLMFLGGSSGSTSGGIKVVRHLVTIRNGFLEFKRALHPNALLPVRFNKKIISETIVFNVLAFFILYMLSFIIGALVLSAIGLDFVSALGVSASSLGNIGPALGNFSPVDTFESMPALGKWWCSFLMLIGRLELFTVLILFTPFFWRNR